MKLIVLIAVAAFAVPAAAAPVHVVLKSAALVQPNADGFFTLGSVTDLSGGDKLDRIRFAAVPVGRAPLSGETRRLTRGDLALKLRQAGCNPDTQVVLEGAEQANVTVGDAASNFRGAGIPIPANKSATLPSEGVGCSGVRDSRAAAGIGSTPLIHRGDAVTVVIQSGVLTITAPGVARENGGVGDSIRIHREGVMTDLTVQVIDAKTVHLEI